MEGSDVPVMEARNLVKQFKGTVKALSDASFKVMPGESVGYLGPNGAGKSTTIKIFTTLIWPTSGRAFIEGHDVTTEQKKALANTGSLVEMPGLYDYLTPLEMMEYVGRVYGMHKKDIEARAEEVLKQLGLGDWMDKRMRTFSTGMRRRYSIGQAVLHDPNLVILDEPVLGLDPAGIREIRYFLQGLKKEGKTVFLSSHLLGEVEEVCDRVLLINKGQILAEESLAELRKSIAGGYLVLYNESPSKEDVEKISAIAGVACAEVDGKQVRVKADGRIRQGDLAKVALVEGKANGIWPLTPNLEDIYIKIINGGSTKDEETICKPTADAEGGVE